MSHAPSSGLLDNFSMRCIFSVNLDINPSIRMEQNAADLEGQGPHRNRPLHPYTHRNCHAGLKDERDYQHLPCILCSFDSFGGTPQPQLRYGIQPFYEIIKILPERERIKGSKTLA